MVSDVLQSQRILRSMRILIVEDEYLLASELKHMLSDAGAEVIGMTPDCGKAVALAESCRPDCVISDINLSGDMAYPFARWAMEAGFPLLFVSGYGRASMPPDLASVALVRKPVDEGQLISTISALVRPT